MTTYDLEVPLPMRLLPLLILALFTVAAPVIILRSDGPTFLIIPFLAIAAWNWWVVLTMAHRIVLHDDGALEWVALIRRVIVSPEEIREIRPYGTGGIGFLAMKHAAGKVRFVNQITGFHEVLFHIKSRNPTVILKGC
jgi:hypothetical protein